MKFELISAREDQIELLIQMNQDLVNDETYDRPPSQEKLKERWISFFTDKYKVFLFHVDDQISGYCVVHSYDEPKYLRHFFIVESFRRQGVGKKAFNSLLDILGVDEIDLDVMVWNEMGIRFWKALGFKERYMGMTYKRDDTK